MTSTGSASTSSAAAPTVRANGSAGIDRDTINVPKPGLRSLSPEKRDFFRQQTPVSPTKRVYNSEFTGRTFSEREQALKDRARGLHIKPLPERKINEVPWLKGKPEWKTDWEIAEELGKKSRGKNVRTLTDEEKALLSPAKATTRAPPATPSPKTGHSFTSTISKSLGKEPQTVFRTSKYGLLGKPETYNSQEAAYTNFKSPVKPTHTATKAPKQGSPSKPNPHNTQEAIPPTCKSAIQEPHPTTKITSKLAAFWRARATNIQQTAAKTSDGFNREPLTVINISKHNLSQEIGVSNTQQTGLQASPYSWSCTDFSVHTEYPSPFSSSMARSTSDFGGSTSCGDTEGAAGAVCVPDPLPEDLPHYELIIWRTFSYKQDARGNDITPKTRKVSFPITQEFAARIAAGQNLTFVNDFNILLEGAQDELALLVPLTTGSDGILFPPEFIDIADKQFADIVGELVRFQQSGYGRWSLDSLRRRVVVNDVACASGLMSHLEAVIVIRMTGFTKKGWLGLPGYDADGNLRLTSPGTLTPENDERSSSSNSGWSDISPGNRTPKAGAEIDSGLVGVQARKGRERYAATPTTGIPTANNVFPRPESSLDNNAGLEDAVDGAMSITLSKIVTDMLKKPLSSQRMTQLPAAQTPTPKGRSAELRLSSSTTPFLPPKRNTQGTIGDGTGMMAWNNFAGEAPDPRLKHLTTSPGASQLQLSPKCSTPVATKKKNDCGSDPDTIPQPKGVTNNNWSVTHVGGRVGTRRTDTADSVPFGQNVLTKTQLEAGKTYVSTKNPSNPIPGALLSPGVIDSEPTLRMVLPTPPPKPTAATKLVINPSNISQHATRRRKADFFGACFPANTASSSVASKSGTGTIRPPAASSTSLTSKLESRGPPAPTKSSQALSNAGATETTGVRHRWEFGTAASLAKGRPPSPVKARSNSPVKNKEPAMAGSPAKRSNSPAKATTGPWGFVAAQPTAASAARAAFIIKPAAKQVSGNATTSMTARPKSRAAGTESSQGMGRTRSRAGSAGRGTGALSRYGTATVRTFEQ